MQQDVGVPLDEARKQSCTWQLHDLRARGINACGRPGGVDPIAFHTDGPALVHGLTIEDARGLEQEHLLCHSRNLKHCEEQRDLHCARPLLQRISVRINETDLTQVQLPSAGIDL